MRVNANTHYAFLAALCCGCVDATPVDFVEPKSDAAASDAAARDGPVDSPCRRCLTDPSGPCQTQWQACAADTRCFVAMECVMDTDCLGFGDFATRLECGQPCLDTAGIKASSDPVVPVVLAVNVCTLTGPCASECITK